VLVLLLLLLLLIVSWLGTPIRLPACSQPQRLIPQQLFVTAALREMFRDAVLTNARPRFCFPRDSSPPTPSTRSRSGERSAGKALRGPWTKIRVSNTHVVRAVLLLCARSAYNIACIRFRVVTKFCVCISPEQTPFGFLADLVRTPQVPPECFAVGVKSPAKDLV